MQVELNPQVVERGHDVAKSLVFDYMTDRGIPAGTPQVLELFLAKAQECLGIALNTVPDDITFGIKGPAPIEVRLDNANEFVSWISVAVDLLAYRHEYEGNRSEPFLDILRRGYSPPLKFNECEQQLFNSFNRMLKLAAQFVDAMPVQPVPQRDECSPFNRDRVFLEELGLMLATRASDMMLMILHYVRPNASLPGTPLWRSKRTALGLKLERLLVEEDHLLINSRGQWLLVQTSTPLSDGTAILNWAFRPVGRRKSRAQH